MKQRAPFRLDEFAAIFANGIQSLAVSHPLPEAIRDQPPLTNQLYCLDQACNQPILPQAQPQSHELRPGPLHRAEFYPFEVHTQGDQLALQALQMDSEPAPASHWLESRQPPNHSMNLLPSAVRPHLKQWRVHHRKDDLLPVLAHRGEHQQRLQE